MQRLALGVLVAIVLSETAFADFLKTEELQSFSEKVMAKVGKGDLDGAFLAMKPYIVIPDAEYETLAVNTRAQRSLAGTRYGSTIGYECLGRETLGLSLAKVTCIEKTEKHALPWRFYFYKAPGGWVLNSFNWSDRLP